MFLEPSSSCLAALLISFYFHVQIMMNAMVVTVVTEALIQPLTIVQDAVNPSLLSKVQYFGNQNGLQAGPAWAWDMNTCACAPRSVLPPVLVSFLVLRTFRRPLLPELMLGLPARAGFELQAPSLSGPFGYSWRWPLKFCERPLKLARCVLWALELLV